MVKRRAARIGAPVAHNSSTRPISPAERTIMPPPIAPGSTALAALLTLVALVPLGAVVGFILAARAQGDTVTYALFGALLGVVCALYMHKR
jgi:hypothetical protein